MRLPRLSALLLALALAAASHCMMRVTADYYDLAEADLQYAYPSVRRVIGMYNLADSPSLPLLGGTNQQPYIQLDLKFSAYILEAAEKAAPADAAAASSDGGSKDAAGTPAATPPADDAAGAISDGGGQGAMSHGGPLRKLQEAKDATPPNDKPGKGEEAASIVLPVQNDDEAAAQMKNTAKENSDVPVGKDGTSSKEVSPQEAEQQREKAAAGDGAAVVAPKGEREPSISANPRVQVLIMQDTTLDSIGHWDQANNQLIDYCCTERLFPLGIDGCDEIGTLIVKGGTVHKIMSAAFLDTKKLQARLEGPDARYDVTSTGEHILIISNCDYRLRGLEIKVSGGGVWKNPYGYLPGRLFGFLPFYMGMFGVYMVLTLTWAVLNCIHRKDVAGIQYFISTALFLTLIEVAAWFIDYYQFNKSGIRHMGGIITAIVFSVLRLTVSRMLVVSVAIGYPVVRPSLGFGTKFKIAILGLVYFACEAALEVVTRYAQTNETAEKWRIFLSLPVAVLNAIFYWWIFTALHDLINYLEQQNQAIKLAMYRTFTHVLAASLVAAVLFALYQIYFMATNQLALHWSLLWLLDGGFQLILYTVIFLCMSWLWRPSSDSRRYAYAELSVASGPGGALGGMDEDEEFGEVEMNTTGGTNGGHGVAADTAKFTVDEDEQP